MHHFRKWPSDHDCLLPISHHHATKPSDSSRTVVNSPRTFGRGRKLTRALVRLRGMAFQAISLFLERTMSNNREQSDRNTTLSNLL